MRESDTKPRVFLSYSYADTESQRFKKIFIENCQREDVIPVVYEPSIGSNIMQDLRLQLLNCDAAVILATKPYSFPMTLEFTCCTAAKMPVVVFSQQRLLPFNLDVEQYIYQSASDFATKLSNVLCDFWKFFENKKPEERQQLQGLMGLLENNLKHNVLVLGKDSDNAGLTKLFQICSVLTSFGYNPLKLKDLPDIHFLSLEDKMLRVAANCRFIIAEDSIASGHIDELRICVDCQFITATVREAGTSATWMQAHYPMQYLFMSRFCYGQYHTNDSLCTQVHNSIQNATEAAITWAEGRISLQERVFRKRIYDKF